VERVDQQSGYGLCAGAGSRFHQVGGLFEQIGRLKMEVEWLKKKLQTFD
jgi:hypothetical protein